MMKRRQVSERIASLLPPEVIYFAAIRLMAHATQGKYSKTVVPELTLVEALNRYERDHSL